MYHSEVFFNMKEEWKILEVSLNILMRRWFYMNPWCRKCEDGKSRNDFRTKRRQYLINNKVPNKSIPFYFKNEYLFNINKDERRIKCIGLKIQTHPLSVR